MRNFLWERLFLGILLSVCVVPSLASAQSEVPPPPAPAVPSASMPAAPSAPGASAAPAAAGPIATADGQASGVTLDVTQLKRDSGGTVTLKWTVVNGGTDEFKLYATMASKEYDSVDGVNLLDAAGKKKYLVVRDSEGNCVCTRAVGSSLRAGEKRNFWAKFPAPPETVEKISIVVPGFSPLDDVPISR
jgi:hypothetical protein